MWRVFQFHRHFDQPGSDNRPRRFVMFVEINPCVDSSAVNEYFRDGASEEWRAVPGYVDYEVSSAGRVRRATPHKQFPAGYLLRQKRNRHGYLVVALSRNGKYWHTSVHRLVALTFLGDPPTPMHEVAHGDGRPTNNRLNNLRWATPAENAADRARHGQWHLPRGEQHAQAVLTDQIVMAMRSLHRHGMTLKDLTHQFGVAKITAWDALKGKTWTHLPV